MSQTSTALCAAITIEGSSSTAPTWLHLLPAGEARTNDGRGPYRFDDAAALIASSMAAGKLPLDENHAIDLAAPKGRPAPARGWIVELQARADGIWGRVDWTAAGRKVMADREYCGVSPVIKHTKDGTIRALLRASLTNTPNIMGLTTLHSQTRFGSAEARSNLTDADREVIRLTGVDEGQYLANLPRAVVLQASTFNAQHELKSCDWAVIRALGVDPIAYATERGA